MTVKLLSPISTKTSNQGDAFTALVESPPGFQNAVVEGKISKLNKARRGTGKGRPEITFASDSITIGGRTVPITADLKQVSNSKGLASVDEEGNAIGKSSKGRRVGTAALLTVLGTGLGAAAGGAKGRGGGRSGWFRSRHYHRDYHDQFWIKSGILPRFAIYNRRLRPETLKE